MALPMAREMVGGKPDRIKISDALFLNFMIP
jgi:hypothetical protein